MAATLASVCSVPLTSVLLLFELTKDYRILLPLMVILVSSCLILTECIIDLKRQINHIRSRKCVAAFAFSIDHLSWKSNARYYIFISQVSHNIDVTVPINPWIFFFLKKNKD